MHRGVERGHLKEPQQQELDEAHADVDAHEPERAVADALVTSLASDAWDLRAEEAPPARGEQDDEDHDDPEPTEPVREGAPETHSVAHALDAIARQDCGAGRREPGGRLEERVHEGRERSREHVGEGA